MCCCRAVVIAASSPPPNPFPRRSQPAPYILGRVDTAIAGLPDRGGFFFPATAKEQTMTKEQLADLLNGRQYRQEITRDEEAQAKAAGLLSAA